MNLLIPRFLRLAYRKEPISSFVLIVGAVDAMIGGVDGRWSLVSFGFVAIAIALVLRWLQLQKAQSVLAQEPARKFLPPSSPRQPLPMLMRTPRSGSLRDRRHP